MAKLTEKEKKLKKLLKDLGSLVVAYSGGVDSTFLLKTALDYLGKDKVLAVTAASETYPQEEISQAVETAKCLGVNHLIIETSELESEDYLINNTDRCYHCKTELFSGLNTLAKEKGFKFVADGSNADDELDFRPGRKAALEFNIRSPLKEVGLSKLDIRQLSKRVGLKNWDKPAFACLASRVPYGTRITAEKLRKIGQAENYIKKMGIDQVRVRDGEETARIEIEKKDFNRLMSMDLNRLTGELKKLGYIFVSLDLDGYRAGSLNELISHGEINE